MYMYVYIYIYVYVRVCIYGKETGGGWRVWRGVGAVAHQRQGVPRHRRLRPVRRLAPLAIPLPTFLHPTGMGETRGFTDCDR